MMSKKMYLNKIFKALNDVKGFKRTAKSPELEGISFRYKTVQFHLIDDSFEEIEKKTQYFGDVKVFSERFSLPGFGITNEILDGDEYQFEVIAAIDSETDKETYLAQLKEVFEKIERKHNVSIYGEPYTPGGDTDFDNDGEFYNLHKIIFYTKEEDVFPKE